MPTTVWPSFSRWCASVNPAGPMPTTSARLPVARARHRPAQVERIPARQQRIDLEAPRQREHVLQDPRLRLRNVDGVGLLVDARLHAVVADAVAGGGDQRIVDADDRERRERPALGAQLVELGDLLLERAAGERHAERALLERIVGRRRAGGLLLEEAARAGVLALLVAPDAVVRLVERAGEVHAGIGQREALAPAHVAAGELPRVDAVDVRRARAARASCSRACAARGTARRPCARRGLPAVCDGPGGVAQRHVERRRVRRFVLLPARHRRRRSRARVNGAPSALSSSRRSAAPSNVAAASARCVFIALRWTNWRLTA